MEQCGGEIERRSSIQPTHKHRHTNTQAPEPFDDMYIHPLEAVGYYCILYCPAAVLPLHPATFFVYMALLGSAGVLDHSGVRVRIPKVSK